MIRFTNLILFGAILICSQAELRAETLHIEKQVIGTADAPPRSITDITAVLEHFRINPACNPSL